MAARSNAGIGEDLLEQFCSITGVSDRSVARYYLEACGGNIELAIGMQMDSGGTVRPPIPEAAGAASNVEEGLDSVRAPIPQRHQVLVEESAVIPGRWRRPRPRTVFDGFRDFQAETVNLGVAGASTSRGVDNNNSAATARKLKTLEDLFRPPVDLIFKGSFRSACDTGSSSNRWLLVNIQNSQEFSCQQLNRDVWSHTVVRDIIREHFIFWQVYSDSEEGVRFIQYYKVKEWPYIAVIDPRTGEKLVDWNKLDAESFTELVSQFLCEHNVPDSTREVSNCHPTPGEGGASKGAGLKRKRGSDTGDSQSSLLEDSEEAQLQAVLRASVLDNGSSSDQKRPRHSVHGLSDSDDDDVETFSSDSDVEPSSPVVKRQRSISPVGNSLIGTNSTASRSLKLDSMQGRRGVGVARNGDTPPAGFSQTLGKSALGKSASSPSGKGSTGKALLVKGGERVEGGYRGGRVTRNGRGVKNGGHHYLDSDSSDNSDCDVIGYSNGSSGASKGDSINTSASSRTYGSNSNSKNDCRGVKNSTSTRNGGTNDINNKYCADKASNANNASNADNARNDSDGKCKSAGNRTSNSADEYNDSSSSSRIDDKGTNSTKTNSESNSTSKSPSSNAIKNTGNAFGNSSNSVNHSKTHSQANNKIKPNGSTNEYDSRVEELGGVVGSMCVGEVVGQGREGGKDDPSVKLSHLLLRLPDGSRKELKLPASTTLKGLHAELSLLGYPGNQYEMITTYPRRNLSSLVPQSQTLEQLQLYPQATVFIQLRD